MIPTMPRHRFLIVLIFLGFISADLVGKEPDPASVRALLLVPGGPIAELHPMSGAIVGEAIQVGARGLSEPFKPSTREFFLTMPDIKQSSGYRSVAKVALPPEGKDFILLLEPSSTTFRVHIVNGKESRFGADALLFFNATDITLGATLGNTKVIMKPREAVFAKAPPVGEKPFYQVTFYESDDGKARIFTNTRWPHRAASRCYVFLYRNASTGRLTYQAVDEEIAPETSTE